MELALEYCQIIGTIFINMRFTSKRDLNRFSPWKKYIWNERYLELWWGLSC